MAGFPATPAAMGTFFLVKEALDGCRDLQAKETVLLRQVRRWESSNAMLAALFLGELADTQIRLDHRAEALDLCRQIIDQHGADELGLAAVRNEMMVLSTMPNGSKEIASRLDDLSRQDKHARLAALARASQGIGRIESSATADGFARLGETILSTSLDWLDLKALRQVVSLYRARPEYANKSVLERFSARYFDIYRNLLQKSDPLVIVSQNRCDNGCWYSVEVVSPFGLREEILRFWRDGEQIRACEGMFKSGTAEPARAKRAALSVAKEMNTQDILTSPCSDLAIFCYDDILKQAERQKGYENLRVKFESLQTAAATPFEQHRAGLFLAKAQVRAFHFEQAIALYKQILTGAGADTLTKRVAARDLLDVCSIGGFEVPDGVALETNLLRSGISPIENEFDANGLLCLYLGQKDENRVRLLCKSFRDRHGYESCEMLWTQSQTTTPKKNDTANAVPPMNDHVGELDWASQTILNSAGSPVRLAALRRFQAAAARLPAPADGAAKSLLAERILRQYGWDGDFLLAVTAIGLEESQRWELATALRIASARQANRDWAWEGTSEQARILSGLGNSLKAFLTLRGFVNRHFPDPKAVEFGRDSEIYLDALFRMASIRKESPLARADLTTQEEELLDVWLKRNDIAALTNWLNEDHSQMLRCEAIWRVAAAMESSNPSRALSLLEGLIRQRPNSPALRQRVTDCRLREMGRWANTRLSVLTDREGKAVRFSEAELFAVTEKLMEAFSQNSTSTAVLAILGPLLWTCSAEGLRNEANMVVRRVLTTFARDGSAWKILAAYPDFFLPVLAEILDGGKVPADLVFEHLEEILPAAQPAIAKETAAGRYRKILGPLERIAEGRTTENERLACLARLAEANQRTGNRMAAMALYERIAQRAKESKESDFFVRWSLGACRRTPSKKMPGTKIAFLTRVIECT